MLKGGKLMRGAPKNGSWVDRGLGLGAARSDEKRSGGIEKHERFPKKRKLFFGKRELRTREPAENVTACGAETSQSVS
jgi:hypothetical protein